MPTRTPAFMMSRNTIRLRTRLITVASTDLVEQPLPPRLGEEVRHDGSEPLDRRPHPLVEIVFAPRFVRPVDQERLALDVLARQVAPVAAVLRVGAVVAHDEILVGRHSDRT